MAYYFYRNMESKYGLHIEMNSGGFFVLISTEMQFLEKSAGMISQIVNDYGKKDIAYKYVFNFKHNNIIDNSIENKDGVIVTGSVGGDIVNEDKQ